MSKLNCICSEATLNCMEVWSEPRELQSGFYGLGSKIGHCWVSHCPIALTKWPKLESTPVLLISPFKIPSHQTNADQDNHTNADQQGGYRRNGWIDFGPDSFPENLGQGGHAGAADENGDNQFVE